MGKELKRNKPSAHSNNWGEIPEVIRDRPLSRTSRSWPSGFMGLALALPLVVALGLWGRQLWFPSAQAPKLTPAPTASPLENILGHLAYEEAPPHELKAITTDGYLRLRVKAAEQFLAMQRAARAEGVLLAPISAFRTVEQQNQLFFAIKQQRNQGARKRAEVSAPPGYSEHHTGYAIDIGDANNPSTHLSTRFEETPAFAWLKANAAKYSFELSFPAGNPQGVSYEPWHWRFIGDRPSLETFYKARALPAAPP